MNAAETVTKQVVVVSKNTELTVLLNRLLARSNWHAAAASPGKAADSCSLADAMVVDLPLDSRGAAVAQIRRRFSGPLIVITRHGEGWSGLSDEDHGIMLLARPFAARELSAAFGIPDSSDRISSQSASSLTANAVPAPTRSKDSAAWPSSAATKAGSEGMIDRSASSGLSMATSRTRTARRGASPTWWNRAAAGLTSSFRDRQRRRLAVGVVFLIVFVGAFSLAARGSCGTGCESLTNGSRVQPTSVTIADPGATASSGRQATGSTTNPQASGPDPGGIQDGVGGLPGATLSATRRSGAATVTQRSGSGSAAAPPTTVSPTTVSPTTVSPTTAPSTTAPSTTVSPTTAPSTTAPSTTAPPEPDDT